MLQELHFIDAYIPIAWCQANTKCLVKICCMNEMNRKEKKEGKKGNQYQVVLFSLLNLVLLLHLNLTLFLSLQVAKHPCEGTKLLV